MTNAKNLKIRLASRLMLWTVEPGLARSDLVEFELQQLASNDLSGNTALPTC